MEVRIQEQNTEIADAVSSLIAVVRPILEALLYGLKEEVVAEFGGYNAIKLKMLPRLYRRGDGDIGLCFEYAVHNAIRSGDQAVLDRIDTALRRCNISGADIGSLLFAVEKTGRVDFVDSVREALTHDSSLLSGTRGRPIKLKRHIDLVAAAFHRPTARAALPKSISGLWKADLFLGETGNDKWVGTTVKVNPRDLRAVKGLRVGIVPSSQGRSDRVRLDEQRNLVVCPMPFDGAFMELFYTAWRIVQQFIAADANVPKDSALPQPHERQVARELAIRRDVTILEALAVLDVQAQPELLSSHTEQVSSQQQRAGESVAESMLAPTPKHLDET
jgi:hypothetical protein